LNCVNGSGKNNGTLQGLTAAAGGLTLAQNCGCDSLNQLTSAS
jgi:hypothetical protein